MSRCTPSRYGTRSLTITTGSSFDNGHVPGSANRISRFAMIVCRRCTRTSVHNRQSGRCLASSVGLSSSVNRLDSATLHPFNAPAAFPRTCRFCSIRSWGIPGRFCTNGVCDRIGRAWTTGSRSCSVLIGQIAPGAPAAAALLRSPSSHSCLFLDRWNLSHSLTSRGTRGRMVATTS